MVYGGARFDGTTWGSGVCMHGKQILKAETRLSMAICIPRF